MLKLDKFYLQRFSMISLLVFANVSYATIATTDYGYGAISKSMGGTGVANPEDSFSSAINPALLAYVDHQADLGLQIFNPQRGYSATSVSTPFAVAPGTHNSRMNYFFIPSLGYVNPFLNQRASWGVALYGNGGVNTAYSGRFNGATIGSNGGPYGGGSMGIDLKQFFLNLGFGWKVNPKLAVGISAIPVMQAVSVNGFLPFSPFSWSPGQLSNRQTQYSYGIGTRLGVLVNPSEHFAFGAAYQPKIKMGQQSKYKGAFPDKGSLNIPSNGTIGLSIFPIDKVTVNFDVQKIWYSDEASYSNPNVCTLGGPLCIGVDGGSGFGWSNPVAFKVGAQWKTTDKLALRVGFVHVNQVVSSTQTLFNIAAPAVTQNHYTAGFTYTLNKAFDLNMNALYAPKVTVTGKNAFNTAQSISLFMTQYELGASLTWKIDRKSNDMV